MMAELHYIRDHFQTEILPKFRDIDTDMRGIAGKVDQVLNRPKYPLIDEMDFYFLLLDSGYPADFLHDMLIAKEFIAYEISLNAESELSNLIIYFLDDTQILQSLDLYNKNIPRRKVYAYYGTDEYTDFIENLREQGAVFIVPKGIIDEKNEE